MKLRTIPRREWYIYALGILALALGTAMMERADFGMSMVTAPSYLIYLRLSARFPALTFGTVSYLFEAVLLAVMVLILRRFRARYLLAFVTAVLFGFALDGCALLIGLLPAGMAVRVVCYLAGMVICALGVSLFFHTDMPPEVYELFVMELSARFGWDVHRCKFVYDCASCLLAVALSFAFFGLWQFRGVQLGSALCALVNGPLIGLWSRLLESRGWVRTL